MNRTRCWSIGWVVLIGWMVSVDWAAELFAQEGPRLIAAGDVPSAEGPTLPHTQVALQTSRGRFVTLPQAAGALRASHPAAFAPQTFQFVELENGRVAWKGPQNTWISVVPGSLRAVTLLDEQATLHPSMLFRLHELADGEFVLQSADGRFIVVHPKTHLLQATGRDFERAERFAVLKLSAVPTAAQQTISALATGLFQTVFVGETFSKLRTKKRSVKIPVLAPKLSNPFRTRKVTIAKWDDQISYKITVQRAELKVLNFSMARGFHPDQDNHRWVFSEYEVKCHLAGRVGYRAFKKIPASTKVSADATIRIITQMRLAHEHGQPTLKVEVLDLRASVRHLSCSDKAAHLVEDLIQKRVNQDLQAKRGHYKKKANQELQKVAASREVAQVLTVLAVLGL